MHGVAHTSDEALTLLELVLQMHGEFRRSLEPIRVTPLQAGVLLVGYRRVPYSAVGAADGMRATVMGQVHLVTTKIS